MKIGIKYCGGCNPTFNRRALVEKLIDEFNNVCVEPVDECKLYDMVLIVCGCLNACVNERNLKGMQKIMVSSEADYNKARNMIANSLQFSS